ncbi:MAG: prepilin peptidase [Patescibacteria group bacterium]
MTSVVFVCLFLFGLAIGSFLNVLILRYSPEGRFFDIKKISGRSHCMSCQKTLEVKELIPLFSFLFLRGKCSSCGEKISFQYPIVEFLSGATFVLVPLFLNSFFGVQNTLFVSLLAPGVYYLFIFVWILIFLSLLLIFVIDLHHYIIPDGLNIFIFILGILLIFLFVANTAHILPFRESFMRNYALIFSPFQNIYYNHILGFFGAGLFFLFLFLVSNGRGMGMGDVKLAFASGIVLGWPDVILTSMIAFIFGGVWAAALYFSKKKTMKDKLPFGPFFVVAFVITIFFGFDLIKGYFSLFNL